MWLNFHLLGNAFSRRSASRVSNPITRAKAAEENWLLKNRKHINKHKGLNHTPEHDISETDPMWLKAKGDDFFHSNDFRSATNAYAEAISAAPEHRSDLVATCLSNRAACLLQLGEFELPGVYSRMLQGAVVFARHSRLGGLQRTETLPYQAETLRSSRYCFGRVDQYSQAKADYGVACSMGNQNQQLREDFMELVLMERANQLKEAGDSHFRESKELEQAVEKHSESLTLNPLSIACLSN